MLTTIVGYLTGLWEYHSLSADPRTENFFMMSSVWYPIVLLFVYLIGSMYIGPWIMTHFEAVSDRYVIDIYCLIVFIYNLVIGALLVFYMDDAHYSFVCQKVNPNGGPQEYRVARLIWVSHLSKLASMADTVFRVIRKDDDDVLILHVFHHATIYSGTWLATRFVPGGSTAMFLVINHWAHCMLYVFNVLHFIMGFDLIGGYFCATVQMQLIQFAIIACICQFNILTGCEYPGLVSLIITLYVGILFIWIGPMFLRQFPLERAEILRVKKEIEDQRKQAEAKKK